MAQWILNANGNVVPRRSHWPLQVAEIEWFGYLCSQHPQCLPSNPILTTGLYNLWSQVQHGECGESCIDTQGFVWQQIYRQGFQEPPEVLHAPP